MKYVYVYQSVHVCIAVLCIVMFFLSLFHYKCAMHTLFHGMESARIKVKVDVQGTQSIMVMHVHMQLHLGHKI